MCYFPSTVQGYIFIPSFLIKIHSNEVRRIKHIFKPYEVLLDAPRAHETVEKTHATCLVVRPACPAPAERLLADNGTCAFVIVVDVPCCVAEAVRSAC